MKTVAVFDTSFEAEVARLRLEAEGIEAVVLNENMAVIYPFVPSFRPYLVVSEGDYDRAVEVLGKVSE